MKNIFYLLFFFYYPFNSTIAGEGIVLVLKTSIFAKPSRSSRILQSIRKGEHVYIYDRDVGKSPYQIDYDPLREFEELLDDKPIQKNKNIYREATADDFYKTLARDGQTAYIEKKYIKLILNDSRETQTNIVPFSRDPTDHRLEEPLPEDYPVYNPNKYRSALYFTIGPTIKTTYPYQEKLTARDFSSQMGGKFSWSKKLAFDETDRLYFGFIAYINTAHTILGLEDGRTADEDRGQFGAGPKISYDLYRNDKYRLVFAGGITFHYNRTLVSQVNRRGFTDERFFSGKTFTPFFSTIFQRRNVLNNMDLFLGIDTKVYIFPYTLRADTHQADETFWNNLGSNDDVISFNSGAQFNLVVGLQINI